tara:strand:- start:447 stop:695 length:249 start_codon:yes stop_codon:yes gene_type:complete
MSFGIIEIKYKEGFTGSKYLYPENEKKFILLIQELQAKDDIDILEVFEKTAVYTKKITWDKTTTAVPLKDMVTDTSALVVIE